MAELPRLRVGLTLDSATFIRETNRVIDSVNKMSRDIQRQNAAAARSFDTMNTSLLRLRILSAVSPSYLVLPRSGPLVARSSKPPTR